MDMRKQLNFFVYSSISSQDLIKAIRQETWLKNHLQAKQLFHKKKYANCSEKQLLYRNALCYAEGFKIAQSTKNPDLIYRTLEFIVPVFGLTLNTSAFLVTIELLGLKGQVEYWRKQVLTGKIIGAYGQTELGHGSNVQMLQTEAVYNKAKKTFTITSPNPTSAKFWPGVLGIFSTHTILQAKTIVEGKNIGVQTFVIEIRNKNLQPEKGVRGFDIGPKLGFDQVDNGGLILTKLEVPREAMLMRYVQVKEDGVVLGIDNKEAIKYGYGSMLNLRVKLTYSFAVGCVLLPTIGYYQVCVQMGISETEKCRKQIIEYCSFAIGTIISNNRTKTIFVSFIEAIEKQDYKQADKHLLNCHIISATFKAVTSWMSLDICTKLLTKNNGVFKTSTIPNTFANSIPSVTYEGDNSVLLQQTAKFLLTKQSIQSGVKPKEQVQTSNAKDVVEVLQYIVALTIADIKSDMQRDSQAGIGLQTIWNERQQRRLIDVALLWGKTMLIKSMAATLKTMEAVPLLAFYEKVGRICTSYIMSTINELSLFGFEAVEDQCWRLMTAEELLSIMEINLPLERQLEPFSYVESGHNWMSAKL